MHQPQSTEALIIGGGPAGLAASIALRQRGIDCTVVEARPPAMNPKSPARSLAGVGIDKACGEGLMPDSRETLAQLGVTLADSDGYLFRGIRFANAVHSVDAHFPDGAGIGVRRPRLHTLLAERAQQAGATLLFDSHVRLPETELSTRDADGYQTATVNGAPIHFRWLIGADGQASSVRKWSGLDKTKKSSLRYGFRTHYRVAPWSDYVEVHWGQSGQLYITPVASDCVCVVYITRDPRCDRANILADFPEVAAQLAGADIASQQRGAVTATCRLRSVATQSVALIGDASGSADAITGEGLAITFRQALALADSITSGSLDAYRTAHPKIGRLPHVMGALMLTLDRWPTFQFRALRTLAHTPAVFRELLQAHIGHRKLPVVVLRRGPAFGWHLITQGVDA
jgi:2-polyprenyl-6-methoxyphenol hydroxylase-like FAD-dependent oxidoreductase